MLTEGRSRGGERILDQTPYWMQSPMWGLIPGHWDHDLNWNQESWFNWLSHPHTPRLFSFKWWEFVKVEYDCMWGVLKKWVKKMQEFFKRFIYLRDREGGRKREHSSARMWEGGAEGERNSKQTLRRPQSSVGLHLLILRSRPELKPSKMLNWLWHLGATRCRNFESWQNRSFIKSWQ